MRTIITLCFILLSFSALAQTKGKILVISPTPTFATDSMYDALRGLYKGEVIKQIGKLPDTLSSYDAIFIEGIYDVDTSNVHTLSSLRSYLQQGGNLFFESRDFYFPEDTLFSQMMGVHSQYNLMMASDIETIKGRDGYFTEGLSWKVNRKLYTDHPDVLKLTGPAEQVLYTCEAYQLQTSTYKVVFHRHFLSYEFLDFYYKTFIGYVACNYFNLCNPLSAANNIESASLQITTPIYIRDRDELLFTYESPSITEFDVSVYNILGERVYYSYNNDASSASSEMRVQLNGRLASGGYFLVVKTTDGVARKPFFVIN
jgi:hypothetical protein